MLNQVPEIAAPHPPHILNTFFPLLPVYGDLSNDSNFYALVSDVCEWVNNNPVPWEGLYFKPKLIKELCKENTLIEIFTRIYEQKALHEGAKYWCCKSMESIYYVDQIETSGLQPIYIYIYRDGRDVALSFKKAVVGPKHIYCLAKKWRNEQALSLAFLSKLTPERFVKIKYEDLITNPKSVMSEIFQKLQVPFTDEIFDYFHAKESVATASSGRMWKNLTRPIISDNFNKFQKELSKQDIYIFERVAGDLLTELDYPLLMEPGFNSPFTEEEIASFEILDKELKAMVLATADKAELARRVPQEEIMSRILNQKRVQHA